MQEDTLTLLSVSLATGINPHVEGALPASGGRRTLTTRGREFGAENPV